MYRCFILSCFLPFYGFIGWVVFRRFENGVHNVTFPPP